MSAGLSIVHVIGLEYIIIQYWCGFADYFNLFLHVGTVLAYIKLKPTNTGNHQKGNKERADKPSNRDADTGE
jgi:hypothetical protein